MKKLSGEEIAILATSIACLISENLDSAQTDLLGNTITLIGSALLTISSKKEMDESKKDKTAAD